jgi:Tol biopolymer transport system component
MSSSPLGTPPRPQRAAKGQTTTRNLGRLIVTVFIAIGASALLTAPAARAQSAVADNAVPVAPSSTLGGMSGDGRWLAFFSDRADLVVGDTNDSSDVFVRDVWNSSTERVSVSSSGVQGDRAASADGMPELSDDGNVVAFNSYATNLVPGPPPLVPDLFVRDRAGASTERFSTAALTGQRVGAVSADGRFVAFVADGLLRVRDRHSGVTELIDNVGLRPGSVLPGDSRPLLSDDGQFLAYVRYVPDVGYLWNVRDRATGTTEPVGPVPIRGEGIGNTWISDQWGCLSRNGRYLVFETGRDLVAGDTDEQDVYLFDRDRQELERISVDLPGASASLVSPTGHCISDDGRYIVFDHAGPDGSSWQVFARDRVRGLTHQLTTAPCESCQSGDITADGRRFAFQAQVAGQRQIYIGDVLFPEPYPFQGFFEPVANPPIVNSVTAGSSVPVKFSLGGDRGLAVLATGYPRSQQVSCASDALIDNVEETVAASKNGLSYDPRTGQYIYVWKTLRDWARLAEPCRQLIIKLTDGTYHRTNFIFR